jgi:hypothetical protein
MALISFQLISAAVVMAALRGGVAQNSFFEH